MNTAYNIDKILAKHFAEETLNNKELELLKKYIENHQDEYNKIKKLVNITTLKTNNITVDVDKAWNNVKNKIYNKQDENDKQLFFTKNINNTSHKSILGQRIKHIVGIAASWVVIMVLVAIAYNKWIEKSKFLVENNNTNIQNLELPDKSNVALYPNSTIEYNYNDERNTREVKLTGKAKFDVKKQNKKAFVVYAADLKVEVLGTAFTIDAAKKDTSIVTVERGRVRLTVKKASVILIKGEGAEISNGKHINNFITNDNNTLKTNNKPIAFNNAAITNVVNEISNKYKVKIDLAAHLKKNTITTKFYNENINDVLKEISIICNCKYDSISTNHYKLY